MTEDACVDETELCLWDLQLAQQTSEQICANINHFSEM